MKVRLSVDVDVDPREFTRNEWMLDKRDHRHQIIDKLAVTLGYGLYLSVSKSGEAWITLLAGRKEDGTPYYIESEAFDLAYTIELVKKGEL